MGADGGMRPSAFVRAGHGGLVMRDNSGAAPSSPTERAEGIDEALMRLVANGDRQAFRQLIQRHLDRIIILARRIVGPAESEDIAQEVFLKIWRQRQQHGTEVLHFKTWLYRVAVNQCLDWKRRALPGGTEEMPDIEDPGASPFVEVQNLERAELVKGAIAQLSQRQRIAITLYYQEDLQASEVAEIMQCELNAVESLLKRGRQKLRENLEKDAFL